MKLMITLFSGTSAKAFLKISVTGIFMMLISCTNNQSPDQGDEVRPYPHFINMTEGFKNRSELRLSDIADSIKYIVLSKDKKVVLESFRRVQMTNDNIYINANGLIMRFDQEGNFLNSIGQNGRGPGEYLNGSPYSTTPDDDAIMIAEGIDPEYLIFKPSGEFIDKVNFPSSSRNLFDFVFVSDSTILNTYYFIGSFMSHEYLDEMSCTSGLFELNGRPIHLIPNPLKNAKISKADLKSIIIPFPTFTFFENRAVLTQKGDTIYEVSGNSVFPGFIIQWDQLQHNKSIEDLYFRETHSSGASYSTFMETTGKAFFPASNNGKSYMFEYDKTSGTTRSMEFDQNNIGFINDLDGGSNFYPYWTNRPGDIWIAVEEAISFKKKHSDDFLSKSIAQKPDLKEKLQDFTRDLNYEDNPVLKILYLKKP